MRLGILDLLSLLGTLIFAIPVGNFGVTRLLAGETISGIALVVVAVAMVVIPYYVANPRTIAKQLAKGLLPKRLSDTSAEPEPEPEPKSESEHKP